METKQNVGGRDRLVRLVLTVVLSIAAVRWLKSGKRIRGLLAGVGALGFGFNATTGYCGINEALKIDTTTDDATEIGFGTDDGSTTSGSAADDDHSLHCAACGEPIVPGESRGPNGEGDIVHDACA